MKKFPFVDTQISFFSFKTIDISENKEHQNFNALKIRKNTDLGSVAKGNCLDEYSRDCNIDNTLAILINCLVMQLQL